jgi:hypothetical protein
VDAEPHDAESEQQAAAAEQSAFGEQRAAPDRDAAALDPGGTARQAARPQLLR